jgi:hypothetical protein
MQHPCTSSATLVPAIKTPSRRPVWAKSGQ